MTKHMLIPLLIFAGLFLIGWLTQGEAHAAVADSNAHIWQNAAEFTMAEGETITGNTSVIVEPGQEVQAEPDLVQIHPDRTLRHLLHRRCLRSLHRDHTVPGTGRRDGNGGGIIGHKAI